MAPQESRLHARGRRVARDRHRVQHRHLHARRRDPVSAASCRSPRPPRRRLHLGQRRRSVRDDLLSGSARLQGPEPGIHRPAGVQPGARRREADGPVASGDGRDRHRQLLSAARRSCCRRPHAVAGRRPSGRAAGGRDLVPAVEPRVRRQSVGRRPVDPDPRPGVHDRRRGAEAVHRHGAAARAGSVDADGLRRRGGAGRHHEHGPVADGQHAARTPRHALDVRERTL